MSDDFDWHGLAAVTLSHLHGIDGYLEAIDKGEWDAQFEGTTRKQDIIEILAALGEHARFTRMALSTAISAGGTEAILQRPLAGLLEGIEWQSDHWLPFTRDDHYFIGTVLPFLIASDGFAHFQRFLRLCGISDAIWANLEGGPGVRIYPGYTIKESLNTSKGEQRFPHPRPSGDIPGFVITGPGWLLAVEATMFRRPTRASFQGQLTKQKAMLEYLARHFGPPVKQIQHVALVPESVRRRWESVGAPLSGVQTITWEDIAALYRFVAPRFWLAEVDFALAHGGEYAIDNHGGAYADATLTGWRIREGYLKRDPRVTQFTYMGRVRGLRGPEMVADIAEGTWPGRRYQVRRKERLHPNWFPIDDFFAALPDPPFSAV